MLDSLDIRMYEAVFIFLFGVIFGSFGNVLIVRLPNEKSIGGRSQCMSCHHVLNIIDLIPIIGFLWRRGKCKYCAHPISWQYPIVETLSGLSALLAFYITDFSLFTGILLSICFWLMLLISVIDIKIQGIPDVLSIPFIVCSIAFGLWTQQIDILSIAIGVVFLGTQWIISGGNWIGAGDILLIIGMGALVGPWPLMIVCMLSAYIFGAAVASVLLCTKVKTRKDSLAFGPFLSIATVTTMLFGAQFLWTVYHVQLT